MKTMNIALPEALKQFVQERVSVGGYNSVSEYMRELIRADQKQSLKDWLETEILKGLASGESAPMTEEDRSYLREELRLRHEAREHASKAAPEKSA